MDNVHWVLGIYVSRNLTAFCWLSGLLSQPNSQQPHGQSFNIFVMVYQTSRQIKCTRKLLSLFENYLNFAANQVADNCACGKVLTLFVGFPNFSTNQRMEVEACTCSLSAHEYFALLISRREFPLQGKENSNNLPNEWQQNDERRIDSRGSLV